MSKNHDENQDVNILKRKIFVNQGTKTIKAAKDANIGIKSWGRIDYLVNYCGYHFIWENGIILDKTTNDDSDKKKNYRNTKKALKEHMLTDKTKRTSNRK